MMNINASKMTDWVSGTLINGDSAIHGVKVDSRQVEPGDLFVCLRGDRVDGHTFAEEVVKRGAACLLVDHEIKNIDVPQIVVDETYRGLRDLAIGYRSTLQATFIGITGSNGKTSTKDILFSVLNHIGSTVATFKNQNTEIGTYLNLFRMDETTQFGVFEMGLDFEGDVSLMTHIIRPHAALIMSLAPAHMSNFKSIEHIASEKWKIFDGVQMADLKFYQGDFKPYRALSHGEHTFGYDADSEWVISNVQSSNKGIEFVVNGVHYNSNLLGSHQASNCAGVIACLTALNIDDEAIRYGLNHVVLTSLRTELVKKRNALVLLDAYKSNPISAKFAIDLLSNYDFDGKRIAVLSDMVELGAESANAHRDVLQWLNEYGIQTIHTLGPEFKKAIALTPINGEITNDDTFEAFYARVQPCFDEHAMILIKGSRSYQLERLMEEGL